VDTLEAIRQRRSVKNFDIRHQITQKEITTILEHAILSPTSYNIQNWRFVTITDQSIKNKLSELSHGQKQVSEASLIIILCADLNSWEKNPQRYWQNIPEEPRNALIESLQKSYRNKPQQQRDEAMRSCGMAAQTIMITAKSMGYDTCPMKGFDYDEVGNLIRLPDDHIITMMVVVGKATKPASPRGGQLHISDITFENHF